MNPISPIGATTATRGQSSACAFSAPFASTDASNHGPSVTVDLSENAKAALARANHNQDAANRILAFVDANRSGHTHRAGHGGRNWSDGKPSLEQEYQRFAGNLSQNPNGEQASQGDVLTITFSEYTNANLSVESGSGAGATLASTERTQYESLSLSVNVQTRSVQIVQSLQSQTDTTAQIGLASPVSITA